MSPGPRDGGKPPKPSKPPAPVGVPYGTCTEEALDWDGPDAAEVVGAVVGELATFWSPLGPADARALLSSLCFVAYEADRLLWDAVSDARERGYGWGEVAGRLHADAVEVERHYAAYCHWREGQGRVGASPLVGRRAKEGR